MRDKNRLSSHVAERIPNVCYTQCGVRVALSSLEVKKSSGSHGISAIALKTCAPELTSDLKRQFSLSYGTDKVQFSWKVAIVHPIPKKGDSIDPSNYRPIAITSLLTKVME